MELVRWCLIVAAVVCLVIAVVILFEIEPWSYGLGWFALGALCKVLSGVTWPPPKRRREVVVQR